MHRTAVNRQKAKGAYPVARPLQWIAPVEGWRTDLPIGNMSPKSAFLLQNWFPEAGYVRARNGSQNYATGLAAAIGSLMPYMGSGSNRLFAAPTGPCEVTSKMLFCVAAKSLFEPLPM